MYQFLFYYKKNSICDIIKISIAAIGAHFRSRHGEALALSATLKYFYHLNCYLPIYLRWRCKASCQIIINSKIITCSEINFNKALYITSNKVNSLIYVIQIIIDKLLLFYEPKLCATFFIIKHFFV